MQFGVLYLLVSASFAYASGTAAQTGSPVEKIVLLLKDLKTKIEQDGEIEQKAYDKFACWCDTATKTKADAVDQANADIRWLGQEILKLKGTIASCASDIEGLTEDMAENKRMQAKSTAVRENENSAYFANADETKQALAAVAKAVEALVEGTKQASLLQVSSVSSQSTAAISALLQKIPRKTSASSRTISLLSEFVADSGREQYAPQSMTVQGILKDMYDTFSLDLETATREEATANRDYESFMATKAKEFKDMKASKASKQADKVDAETSLADATSLYDKTTATKAADIEFFDTTKKTCVKKFEEWDSRRKARAAELKGIRKTIEILTSDEAREIFAESKPTSFVQIESVHSVSKGATEVAKILRKKAIKSKSVRLMQVATKIHNMQGHPFAGVIKDLDEMVATLKEEASADLKKKNECNKLYTENAKEQDELEWKITNNKAKIDKLQVKIKDFKEQKTKVNEEIKETKKTMADMTVKREEANQAYLKAKKADLEAIKLLEKAHDALLRLEDPSLIQKEPEFSRSEFDAPDLEFSNADSRKTQTAGVVGLMKILIEDIKDEVVTEEKEEAEAQTDFEASIKSLTQVKDDLLDTEENLKEMIADRKSEKTDEQTDKKSNVKELEAEVAFKAKIKTDCDWILSAFDQRAEQRAAELEGLSSAKSYLAGATEVLLQHSKSSIALLHSGIQLRVK